MEGYLSDEPKFQEIINRWLGPDGLVSIPPELIEMFFENIIFTKEQIPLDDN
jgi:polar amino acid transport system substrate-binding protein